MLFICTCLLPLLLLFVWLFPIRMLICVRVQGVAEKPRSLVPLSSSQSGSVYSLPRGCIHPLFSAEDHVGGACLSLEPQWVLLHCGGKLFSSWAKCYLPMFLHHVYFSFFIKKLYVYLWCVCVSVCLCVCVCVCVHVHTMWRLECKLRCHSSGTGYPSFCVYVFTLTLYFN